MGTVLMMVVVVGIMVTVLMVVVVGVLWLLY